MTGKIDRLRFTCVLVPPAAPVPRPSSRVATVNGAESLIRTLIDAGLTVCFANPGTTEMPMVRALDDVPGMRAVLGLFEGVCTGAADGYARMTGRPALTLLHLGPGFANGIANLHNARRAALPPLASLQRPSRAGRRSDLPSARDRLLVRVGNRGG